MNDTQFDQLVKMLDNIRCCIIDVEEAALRIVERLPSASPNSQSDEIAALRKEIQSLREVVGHHQTFVGLHTPLGGKSARLA